MCGSECEGAGAGSSVHLSSPDKGESVFCSDHCFALHRRQVYRQSGRQVRPTSHRVTGAEVERYR